MRNVRLILLIVLALPGILPGATEPLGFFLTWKNEPCTTMVVDWHVAPGTEVPPLQLRKLGASGIVFLGDGAWGVAPREPHADSWYLAKSPRRYR